MKNPKFKLTDHEFLEMSDYSHEELLKMFKWAIEDQAARGILSPEDAKKYLANIDLWLLELMEN
jgi:hypothetical protein